MSEKENVNELEDNCPKCCISEPPKMGYYISDEAPFMFKAMHEMLADNCTGNLFIAFEMGSIRLDISDPANWIEINRDYIMTYNNDNGETSVITTSKIVGFIYEPEHVCSDDCEEELREALGL